MIIDTLTLEENSDKLSQSEIYWTYCALDCCVTYDVIKEIEPQLDEVSRATYNTSMETIPIVMEMMLEGFKVDEQARINLIKEYERKRDQLEANFIRLCVDGLGLAPDRKKRTGGRSSVPVNPSSPLDLQFLFHTVLQIPEKKKRKKGQDEAKVTTDREVLEGFRSYFYAVPFVNHILAMRDCNKAIGFLRSKLDPDGRIRCSFNIAGTKTGRLNSSFSDTGTGTNLQNVTGKLKNVFVADQGYMIVDVDLEQGDSRGVGAIAWNWFVERFGETWAGSYLDACESGDLHTTVTRMAWPHLGWPDLADQKAAKKVAEQIAYRDFSYRDLSKKLGHGTNYLGQPNTMAMHAKLPVSTIADFQLKYFKAFQCIPAWQQQTIKDIRETRCLITPWGRRRWFWDDPNTVTTHNAAIAYSPQSTTGEFINRGAIQLMNYRNQKNLPIRFRLQVHDSLVLLVSQRRIDELIPIILDKLRVVLPLAKGREFTIPHGVKVGWNYGMYDEETNPYGLKKWAGAETRTAPQRISSMKQLLELKLPRG